MSLRVAAAAVALGSALIVKQRQGQASKRRAGHKPQQLPPGTPAVKLHASKPTTEPTTSPPRRSAAFRLMWLLLLAWASLAAQQQSPGSTTQWLLATTVAVLVLTLYLTRHSPPKVDSNRQLLLNDKPMQEAAKAAKALQQLEGEWIKDKQRSTDMQAAMDLVHLNPLVKKAVTLVTGVIIRVTEADIELAVTCKVPWFKVVEEYSLAGFESQHRRRDLRRGLHTAHVEVTFEGELLLFIRWDDPWGGFGQERYYLSDEDTMICDVKFTVNGQTAGYRIVHRRKVQN